MSVQILSEVRKHTEESGFLLQRALEPLLESLTRRRQLLGNYYHYCVASIIVVIRYEYADYCLGDLMNPRNISNR